MLGPLQRSGSGRFAATILILALILQGMALAVAAGRLAYGVAGGTDATGFEICRHPGSASTGGDAPAPGGAPEQRSGAHCVLCLAGGTYALGAPPSNPAFHVVAFTIIPWTFTVWPLPAHTVDSSARPRGPPPA
jgi:hypothetical protein